MFRRPGWSWGRRGGWHTLAPWLAGGCVAAMYLGTVMTAWPFPVRLLYDGLVPLPPYRWVHPPASRARDNKQALPGSGIIAIGPPSRAVEVATDDDQALVTFAEGVIAPHPGDSSVKVAVVPLDPTTVAPAPGARRFDGNAYRIEATYTPSGAPAVLVSPVTVVLRYPVHATLFFRLAGAAWEPLPPQVFTGSQQILANTDRVGVFVPGTLYNARYVTLWGGGTKSPALGTALAGLLAAAAARGGSRGSNHARGLRAVRWLTRQPERRAAPPSDGF
jgi:hypothetical protein